MTDPRYPIGQFVFPETFSPADRARSIERIAAVPAKLRATVRGLDDGQLDTPYRDGGWTVRQVVHHVPDSHLNAYIRFKLALTEDEPTIKPYDEARWAELADSRAPISVSLDLLDAVHHRWILLLRSFGTAEFARAYKHPDMGVVPLDAAIALYAWHGAHHTAHLKLVRD